ncbi:hypothetical protein B0H14DRAFT_2583285 [Mycena olivaceomarginata]|nr:hypothetical protein B0H14DRAFT_2583285 [Mycena olivaceomarginata]
MDWIHLLRIRNLAESLQESDLVLGGYQGLMLKVGIFMGSDAVQGFPRHGHASCSTGTCGKLLDFFVSNQGHLNMAAGAQPWWNGPDAKKKRSHADMEATSASGSGFDGLPNFPHDPATPPSKKVSFERRYDDGGATRFYGPRIKPGRGSNNVFYRWPLSQKFVPIPPGYQSTVEEEHVSDDEHAKAEAWICITHPLRKLSGGTMQRRFGEPQ